MLLLYVEDHLPSVTVLEAVLALRPGWRIHHAERVATAVATAAGPRPDLVVLDMNLPDGTGLDVLAAFNADPALRDVPVVVLSAGLRDDMAERAITAGAQAYWTKPLDLRQFLAFLDGISAGTALAVGNDA